MYTFRFNNFFSCQRRYEAGDYWKWAIPYGERINFHSRNTQSLGSLLNGFFDYFTNRFE